MGVVGTRDIGEGWPPLLWAGGFREAADDAGQLDPNRTLTRAVFPGLDEPSRRIVDKLGQLGVGQPARDTVAVCHLQRDI